MVDGVQGYIKRKGSSSFWWKSSQPRATKRNSLFHILFLVIFISPVPPSPLSPCFTRKVLVRMRATLALMGTSCEFKSIPLELANTMIPSWWIPYPIFRPQFFFGPFFSSRFIQNLRKLYSRVACQLWLTLNLGWNCDSKGFRMFDWRDNQVFHEFQEIFKILRFLKMAVGKI